ncbi:MAG: hypothetical protein IJP33_03410 [Firmicutes bacterium]|nr:hypothetical protein [Bacillota bacterium]
MLQGILSMFHIENTGQLRELLQNFGHFLPPEQLELINAVVNEIDKGEDMNREALAAAADYLSAGANDLQEQLPLHEAESSFDAESIEAANQNE